MAKSGPKSGPEAGPNTAGRSLRVGLIGTGFMGRAHAFGYRAAGGVAVPGRKGPPASIVLATVADIDETAAKGAAQAFGFGKATGDWRSVTDDPDIDIVAITAPNALHREMSLAAIEAGKHVHCEKPLAPSAAEAREMAEAAEAAGVKTQVGFNYLCNPVFALARDMIAAGELGEVRGYRGIHAEDYMADAASPTTFRHDPAGGGALADLGSHALATAEFLAGPVAEVMGECVTVIGERPSGEGGGGRRKVEVDDVSRAFLRFAGGATGTIEANWIATGRKMQHDWEIYGSKGSLAFTGERLNELHYYSSADADGRRGYRKIEAGPEHPPYGSIVAAPGHQLGFNDLKAIEAARFAAAIAGGTEEPFNFRAGLRVQSLVEHIQRSAREGNWLKVED